MYVQCCATGLTAEGKTPKTLVEEMVPLLDSQEVMLVFRKITLGYWPDMFEIEMQTKCAWSRFTSNIVMVFQTRTADDCINMHG